MNNVPSKMLHWILDDLKHLIKISIISETKLSVEERRTDKEIKNKNEQIKKNVRKNKKEERKIKKQHGCEKDG